MRRDNQPAPHLNRAVLTLSASHYDRRALDVTAVLPLTHSCIHFAAQLRASAAVRRTAATDGALDRLVAICESTRPTDARTALLWITAFNAMAALVTNGDSLCKVAAAKRGVLRVCMTVVGNFVRSMSAAVQQQQQQLKQQQQQQQQQPSAEVLAAASINVAAAASQLAASESSLALPLARTPSVVALDPGVVPVAGPAAGTTNPHSAPTPTLAATAAGTPSPRNVVPTPHGPAVAASATLTQTQPSAPATAPPSVTLASETTPFHLAKHQDIVLSLQILAALVPLPAVQAFLRQPLSAVPTAGQPSCALAFIEPLTRLPMAALRDLAVRIVVAAAQGGSGASKPAAAAAPVRCAHLACSATESSTRPFARCARCKCTRYCSKQCQVAGWSAGHRYWCNAAAAEAAVTAAAASSESSEASPASTADVPSIVTPTAVVPSSARGVPYARPGAAAASSPSSSSSAGSSRLDRMRAAARQGFASAVDPLAAPIVQN